MSIVYYFLPVLAAWWSFFVATGYQLYPRQKKIAAKRKAKAISSERVDAIADVQGTSNGKELALPDDVKVPPVYEVYDHPAPPIPLLGASLPSAPIGYGWEIVIVNNDHGNPAMKLCLLNLATTMEVASIEGDLVVLRRWKYANPDTYASHYRKVERMSEKQLEGWKHTRSGPVPVYGGGNATEVKGKVMMANLVTPMVDWARMLVLRYIVDNPDETKCNYLLIESGGERIEMTVSA